jgi:hypothetical protein
VCGLQVGERDILRALVWGQRVLCSFLAAGTW